MDRSVPEQLRIVKVTIETVLPVPCRIVVISASDTDGTAELAVGLAKAFAASNKRTAVILAAHELHRAHEKNVISDSLHSYKIARDDHRAYEAVERIVEDTEAQYSVVIVDGGTVAERSASLHIAAKSDGVLIAVRLGRRVSRADVELPPLLGRVGVRMLGIVTLDPAWLTSADAGSDTFGYRSQAIRDIAPTSKPV
jgi:Mrp family chromosome partitioning ATPase